MGHLDVVCERSEFTTLDIEARNLELALKDAQWPSFICSSVLPGAGSSGPTTILAVCSTSRVVDPSIEALLLQPRSSSKTKWRPSESTAS